MKIRKEEKELLSKKLSKYMNIQDSWKILDLVKRLIIDYKIYKNEYKQPLNKEDIYAVIDDLNSIGAFDMDKKQFNEFMIDGNIDKLISDVVKRNVMEINGWKEDDLDD